MATKTFTFKRTDTIHDPAQLTPGSCVSADNVDFLTPQGYVQRQGKAQRNDVAYHSLFATSSHVYGVRSAILYDISSTATAIKFLPNNERLFYSIVGDGSVVYGNDHVFGHLSGATALPTFDSVDTVYVNDGVETPTGKLRITAGMPCWFAGRMWSLCYSGGNSVLQYTDGYDFNGIDCRGSWFNFPGMPADLFAVDECLYVGTTEGLYVLKGLDVALMTEEIIYNSPVAVGTSALIEKPVLSGQQVNGPVVIIATGKGILACMNGGVVMNISEQSFSLPDVFEGAGYTIRANGQMYYVASLKCGRSETNRFNTIPIVIDAY